MKRPAVYLLMFLCSFATLAQRTLVGGLSEDSSIDGTEELYCENSANTVASMCKLSTIFTALGGSGGTCIEDADADTSVCVEESADEDLVVMRSGAASSRVAWKFDGSANGTRLYSYLQGAGGAAWAVTGVGQSKWFVYDGSAYDEAGSFSLELDDTTADSIDSVFFFIPRKNGAAGATSFVTGDGLGTDGRLIVGEYDGSPAACISFDSGADRLYHDTDCDGTKDSGENYVDHTGGAGGDSAPYGQYDPLNPPSSCATCEEWTGDTASLTWEWGNQDGVTETIERDRAYLEGDGVNEYHIRWTDPPSSGNTDFVLSAVGRFNPKSTGDACGIAILHGGTVASPTNITILYYVNTTTDAYYFFSDTDYNPAAGVTVHGSPTGSSNGFFVPNILQIRYTDSTREATGWVSVHDEDFKGQIGAATTLANDPIKIGYLTVRDADCVFSAVRARTDADRNFAGE